MMSVDVQFPALLVQGADVATGLLQVEIGDKVGLVDILCWSGRFVVTALSVLVHT